MKKYKVMYSGDPESLTTFNASSPEEAAKSFYFKKKEKKHIFVNSFMSEKIFKWEDFEENLPQEENIQLNVETDESPTEVPTRPTGVSILAVLSIIGGLALLIMQFFVAKHYYSMTEYTGVSGTAMLTNVIILGVWALLAGIGMWMGKRWGWWLGATYLLYSVLRNANAVYVASELISQYPEETITAAQEIVKRVLRVIFYTFLTFYYFKGNVLTFFGFPTSKKWKRILIFIGISISVSGALAAITAFL